MESTDCKELLESHDQREKKERKMTGRRGIAETEILEGESLLGVRTRQDHRNAEQRQTTRGKKCRKFREDSKWYSTHTEPENYTSSRKMRRRLI